MALSYHQGVKLLVLDVAAKKSQAAQSSQRTVGGADLCVILIRSEETLTSPPPLSLA